MNNRNDHSIVTGGGGGRGRGMCIFLTMRSQYFKFTLYAYFGGNCSPLFG